MNDRLTYGLVGSLGFLYVPDILAAFRGDASLWHLLGIPVFGYFFYLAFRPKKNKATDKNANTSPTERPIPFEDPPEAGP